MLVHREPERALIARILCAVGLIPNTAGAVIAAGPDPRSKLLSLYLGIGGAAIGLGYLYALGPRRESSQA